jgi:capsular exopolysaccharide synthesis family protein
MEQVYDHAGDDSRDQSWASEPPLASYLRVLRAGAKTWALAAIAGLALGWSLTAASRPYYSARASVELADSQQSFLGIADVKPDSRFSVPAAMATWTRILGSDGLLQAAVERLIHVPVGPPNPKWAAEVYAAAADIEITAADDGRIIDISCQTASPEAAAGIVNALAEQFVVSERERSLKQLAETRRWMEDQLDMLAASAQRSARRPEEHAGDGGPSLDDSDVSAARLALERRLGYRRINREAEANRELYAAFLRGLQQAAMTAGATAGTARVLDTAKVPTEPLGPRPALGAIAGMLIGLFASCLFVVAKAKLDNTIKRPGDARRALGLRELGAMPDAAFEQERVRMTPAGFASKEPTRAEKAYLDDRPSWLAECVRGIRTSLLLGPESPQVITVTSPTPGDGKTTVAANLAASLAESNRRTLIVDADLRRPRLHEVFGVSSSQGLVDLLADSYVNPLDFAVQVSEGLWLLPAGVAAFGGPGLIHEAATQELLERLKCEFDVIIVDAPPVLAVSDARALSSVVDGTILVVRAGVTEPDDAIKAKTLLEEDGAHLLGVVLNSWNPRVYGPEGYRKYGANYQSSSEAA